MSGGICSNNQLTLLKSLTMTFLVTVGYLSFVVSSYFHGFNACNMKIMIRTNIICCMTSVGFSGNHAFIIDIRLLMIGICSCDRTRLQKYLSQLNEKPIYKIKTNLPKENRKPNRFYLGIVWKLVIAKRKLILQKKSNPQFIC